MEVDVEVLSVEFAVVAPAAVLMVPNRGHVRHVLHCVQILVEEQVPAFLVIACTADVSPRP